MILIFAFRIHKQAACMISYMHCRPTSASHYSFCPSIFSFSDRTCSTRLNCPNPVLSSCHSHPSDQISPLTPRRRRRLADPIISFASNYYSTYPSNVTQVPMCSSPATSPMPTSISPDRHRQKRIVHDKRMYCDLFNLLEYSETPLQQVEPERDRRSNHLNSGFHGHEFDDETANSSRMKPLTTDRKRSNQQVHYRKAKKHQGKKLSSTDHHDHLPEKGEKLNDVYQQHFMPKGFFRRIVRHYFCVPSTVSNNGYSS